MSNQIVDTTHNLIDQAAHSADAAIQGTQRLANQAAEGVSHSLQAAGKQVRNGAHQVSDRTVSYLRDEPVKSMFIAAATGAAIVALASLFNRPRSQK